jgi:hypothetical protein
MGRLASSFLFLHGKVREACKPGEWLDGMLYSIIQNYGPSPHDPAIGLLTTRSGLHQGHMWRRVAAGDAGVWWELGTPNEPP